MKLLCATDLLSKSEAAVNRAGMLADALGTNPTLMHVVKPSETERVLEQTLQVAIAHMKSRAPTLVVRTADAECRRANLMGRRMTMAKIGSIGPRAEVAAMVSVVRRVIGAGRSLLTACAGSRRLGTKLLSEVRKCQARHFSRQFRRVR